MGPKRRGQRPRTTRVAAVDPFSRSRTAMGSRRVHAAAVQPRRDSRGCWSGADAPAAVTAESLVGVDEGAILPQRLLKAIAAAEMMRGRPKDPPRRRRRLRDRFNPLEPD